MNVLIIEDHIPLQNNFKQAIKSFLAKKIDANIDIVLVENARDLIEKANLEWDLIICDYDLNNWHNLDVIINGFHFCSDMIKSAKSKYTILYSSRATLESIKAQLLELQSEYSENFTYQEKPNNCGTVAYLSESINAARSWINSKSIETRTIIETGRAQKEILIPTVQKETQQIVRSKIFISNKITNLSLKSRFFLIARLLQNGVEDTNIYVVGDNVIKIYLKESFTETDSNNKDKIEIIEHFDESYNKKEMKIIWNGNTFQFNMLNIEESIAKIRDKTFNSQFEEDYLNFNLIDYLVYKIKDSQDIEIGFEEQSGYLPLLKDVYKEYFVWKLMECVLDPTTDPNYGSYYEKYNKELKKIEYPEILGIYEGVVEDIDFNEFEAKVKIVNLILLEEIPIEILIDKKILITSEIKYNKTVFASLSLLKNNHTIFYMPLSKRFLKP